MSGTDPDDLSDEQLQTVLRDVLAPVTGTHRAAAVGAYEWRFLDAALATLAAPDHREEPVLRDSADQVRQLTFATDDETISVDIEPTGADQLDVVVVITAALPYDGCALRLADGSGRALALDDGTAVATGIPARATFRVECQRAGKVAVVTEWIGR